MAQKQKEKEMSKKFSFLTYWYDLYPHLPTQNFGDWAWKDNIAARVLAFMQLTQVQSPAFNMVPRELQGMIPGLGVTPLNITKKKVLSPKKIFGPYIFWNADFYRF